MARHDQTHDRLSVYGTNGEEYYPDPDTGSTRPEVGEWFMSSQLRFYLDTSEPELMVYLGDIRHPHEQDQAFAVYRGSNTQTVFEDLEREVEEQLVERQNWKIIDQRGPTDQKSVFHYTVRKSDRSGRPRPLTKYSEYDAELYERVLKADNTQNVVGPVEVIANNYRVASELVHSYSHVEPVLIHVYQGTQTHPPQEVDLAIHIAQGGYEVKIPTSTGKSLASWQARIEQHKAKQRKTETVAAIREHAEADDRPDVVQDAVDEGFEEYYDSLEVIEAERRERLQDEHERALEELEETRAELSLTQGELEDERQRVSKLRRRAKFAGFFQWFKRRGTIGVAALVSLFWIVMLAGSALYFDVVSLPTLPDLPNVPFV